jgi:hypothetical protein
MGLPFFGKTALGSQSRLGAHGIARYPAQPLSTLKSPESRGFIVCGGDFRKAVALADHQPVDRNRLPR